MEELPGYDAWKLDNPYDIAEEELTRIEYESARLDAADDAADDGWYEAWHGQYDDDPNPYNGTYSEE